MKPAPNVLSAVLLSILFLFSDFSTASGQTTVFRNIATFDGDKVLPAATVIIRDTEIVFVSDQVADADIPEGAEVISGEGLMLMPGLIDAHTHTFSRENLERALDFGVTTSFDMWTSVEFMQRIQQESRQGLAYDRADLYFAGIGATAPDSHGTQFGPVPTLTQPQDADPFVADRIAEGSDYIKIIYDNFKMWDRPIPTLDFDTLAAVVASAKARDRLVVVHSRDVDAYADVVRAGADGIVHITVDEVPGPDLIEALQAKGLFVIPTLSISTPSGPEIADDPVLAQVLTEREIKGLRGYSPMHRPGGDAISLESVRVLNEAGITILAGSDSPNRGTATGVSIHQEMAMLVEAGLTPVQALAAATSSPAESFELSDRGRIQTGRRADLLLVKGDPSSNINDTRKIVGVWKAGQRHTSHNSALQEK